MDTKPEIRVVFFRTDRGNDPVREWLEGLGERDEKTIDADIAVVAGKLAPRIGYESRKKAERHRKSVGNSQPYQRWKAYRTSFVYC